MSNMKINSLRMLALVASFITTMTASAEMVNDSLLADTAQWYNKTHELSEVTVKSSLPKIRTNADGMKVIIAGSELEKVGNSKDLLKRLPSIKKVDDDGVELFGRGAAEIYVNGRKVYDNSELDQIPSDQIINVEIITNPGARYKATTKAVVKIKTKRPQGEGWGFRDELKGYYRAGMSVRNQLDVNYRHGGLDIGGWVIGESSNTGQHQNERVESYIGNKLLVQDITETDFKAKNRDLDFGLKTNYIFNENHSIGARYEYYRLPYSKVDLLFPSKFTIDGEYLQESLSDVITREPRYRHNFNTYYSGKIANWQIDFNLDGVWFDHKQRGETSELISLPEQASRTDYVKTYTHNNSRLYAAKLVLEHPLFGGKVCLGTEYDDTRRTSVSENPKATDGDTKVDERIWAGFLEYKRVFFDKLSLNAGLRYENVQSDYYDFGKHEMDRDYDDWFPSVGLAMPIGKVQLGAHYGIDIARPSFSNLSEVIYYVNSYSYQTGNSKLKPTYTHNISLNASWKWLWVEAAYNKIVDDIQTESIRYSEDNDLITLIHPNNLSTYHRYSFQAYASPTLFNVWHPTIGGAITGQDYESVTPDGSMKKMNTPLFTGTWNNIIMLKKGWQFGVDFFFQSSGDYATYHLNKACFCIDAHANKSLFNDKLNIGFKIHDITRSRVQPVTVYSQRSVWVKSNNAIYCELTATYKFNVAADKYKGKGAGDKIKNRIK